MGRNIRIILRADFIYIYWNNKMFAGIIFGIMHMGCLWE